MDGLGEGYSEGMLKIHVRWSMWIASVNLELTTDIPLCVRSTCVVLANFKRDL